MRKPVILSEGEGSLIIFAEAAQDLNRNDQRFFATLRMTDLFMRWLLAI